MLLPSAVLPFISRFVLPSLLSIAILQIVEPHTLVLRAIYVVVCAVTISFIIFPHAVKNIAVYVVEDALAVCLILVPFAFVPSAIWPDLNAVPMPHLFQPLAFVHDSVLKSALRVIIAICGAIVLFALQLLHYNQVRALRKPICVRCPKQLVRLLVVLLHVLLMNQLLHIVVD